MTVRCDACGTENRDKAMFCRGCAGKLPAFAITKGGSADAADVGHPVAPPTGRPRPPGATSVFSSGNQTGASSRHLRARAAILATFAVVLGVSAAWTLWPGTEAGHQTPTARMSSPSGDTVPPQVSLSSGETLEESSSPSNAVLPQGLSPPPPNQPVTSTAVESPPKPPIEATAANASPAISNNDVEPPVHPRNSAKRSSTPAHGGSRALDPRVGCEHLFFAFAARCEANHCQEAAHARHPRCDLVREQRRKDEARRNSMPTS